jgi:hypothetical protein
MTSSVRVTVNNANIFTSPSVENRKPRMMSGCVLSFDASRIILYGYAYYERIAVLGSWMALTVSIGRLPVQQMT